MVCDEVLHYPAAELAIFCSSLLVKMFATFAASVTNCYTRLQEVVLLYVIRAHQQKWSEVLVFERNKVKHEIVHAADPCSNHGISTSTFTFTLWLYHSETPVLIRSFLSFHMLCLFRM